MDLMMCDLIIKKQIIIVLQKYLNYLYAECSHERGTISKLDWDNDNIDSSILFEIEIITCNISGIATSCVSGYYALPSIDISTLQSEIAILDENSIYKSKIFQNWVIEVEKKYSNFLSYILTLENIRFATLDYLNMAMKNIT